MRQEHQKRSQLGYNLVEVLIAMAILGTVLISIMSLFFMGQRNVYSGKQMTRAISVGTRIMEDISPITRATVEDSFGLTDVAGADVTFGGQTYPNSVIRVASTDKGNGTKDANAYLQNWSDLLALQGLGNGDISVIISAVNPTGTAPFEFDEVPVFRIRVFVEWDERLRDRFVMFDTTKVDRTL